MDQSNELPMTMKEKIKLKNRMKILNKNDYIFIFLIIKKYDDCYSHNNNGVWVNLNMLPNVALWKIDKYLKTMQS